MVKVMKRIISILVILLIQVFAGVGFSDGGPPSTADIHSAITNYLQTEVPVSWTGNLMGGRNAKISSVEIVKRGLYNKEQNYWPYKIHVIGVCELNDPFNQGKRVDFDKTGDFVLYKDDYGDWKSSLRGGMFQ